MFRVWFNAYILIETNENRNKRNGCRSAELELTRGGELGRLLAGRVGDDVDNHNRRLKWLSAGLSLKAQTKENLPRPSKKTIAAAIGVEPRTVQRRIAAMEKAEFIKRLARSSAANGSNSNLYDFSGLIAAAEPFARRLQEIEQRKKASTEKLARKRPRLAVVNG